jgi:hypothetical protein
MALCYYWRIVLAEVLLLLLLLAFTGCCNATMTDGGVEEEPPAPRSCERLKGSLTYTQQEAPDDVSVVVRLYVGQSVCSVKIASC